MDIRVEEDQMNLGKKIAVFLTDRELGTDENMIGIKIVEKIIDKLAEDLYAEILAGVRQNLPNLVSQVGGEIVRKGLLRLNKENEQ